MLSGSYRSQMNYKKNKEDKKLILTKYRWLQSLTTLLALMLCMSVFSVRAFAVEVDWEVEPPINEQETMIEVEQVTTIETDPDPTETGAPIFGEPAEIAAGGELPAWTGFRPFTPSGTATVIDNATGEDGKEFFTIMTEAENVFYLVIDRQRNSKNVYFLNAVTEADLLALVDVDELKPVNAASPETATPSGQKPTITEDTEPVMPPEAPVEKSSSTGLYVFVIIAVLGVGAAAYYIKIVKPKKDGISDDADDYDDEYDYDGELEDDDDILGDEFEEGGENE